MNRLGGFDLRNHLRVMVIEISSNTVIVISVRQRVANHKEQILAGYNASDYVLETDLYECCSRILNISLILYIVIFNWVPFCQSSKRFSYKGSRNLVHCYNLSNFIIVCVEKTLSFLRSKFYVQCVLLLSV